MNPAQYPAVVIDGSVARTGAQRCEVVLAYYGSLPGADADIVEVLRDELRSGELDDETEGWETRIIDMINSRLPDDFVCTVGEQQPGDVIVREVGHPDDEMEAM